MPIFVDTYQYILVEAKHDEESEKWNGHQGKRCYIKPLLFELFIYYNLNKKIWQTSTRMMTTEHKDGIKFN